MSAENPTPPQFEVGDKVRETNPFVNDAPEYGTVRMVYEFEGQYRYIVQFEGGRESVLFEGELIQAAGSD